MSRGTSTRRWAFHGLTESATRLCRRLRTGKGAESKQRVMQGVRESHGGHDGKHSTNPRHKVTLMLLNFPRLHQRCCKNRNKQYQSSNEPNV